ncbi:tissue factor pathway inhibitor a [Betta splendens]|uniref:Tissue factor pathway inhibitor n=1 Tax=Betta splendens TaxID=158456 RepID=A0A6P7LHH3_BETSP|nr:tissue factor pathway inhibitor a [Betta splendens]
MAAGKWWLWCVVWLLVRRGSCKRHGHDGAPHEPLIFSELCALKDESGPCKAIKERFFFDVNTRTCQVFEYGGCGGNSNNFESLEECERTCIVTDDKDPCHLPEAPGPCRGLVTRYFFDTESQQCKSFFYGGCFGNANNFKSMEACQAKCQNPAKPSQAPELRRLEDAQPTFLTGEQTVFESQVQLNNANQETKDLKRDPACLSPEERGTCEGEDRRFAFDPATRRCRAFIYSGCGGNDNNFQTRKQCFKKCIKRKSGHRQGIPVRRKVYYKLPHSDQALH